MAEHTHKDKHDAHRKLIDRLRQQADDVRRLTAELEESLAAKRIAPEKWSVKELVCHLDRMQDVFAGRIEAMIREDNPAVQPYNPDHDADFEKLVAQPAADTVARFLGNREHFIARLAELSPAEWHRPGAHPDFPRYDVHFQVEYMTHHEAHHVYQMFQRRIPLGKIPH